ncbi:DeoC/LacD family aldolase [Rhizoctonia solani]|uniref:DeoC/LacD family aldolase n=1 Tax=Rhizoctonia solani TaxID=456999 RepID=A0A8H7IDT5_9AGAM|nr:DeoC/LacD family aldolase [Rhizoctonia solani]
MILFKSAKYGAGAGPESAWTEAAPFRYRKDKAPTQKVYVTLVSQWLRQDLGDPARPDPESPILRSHLTPPPTRSPQPNQYPTTTMPIIKLDITLKDLSKMIDVSLLHPTMTDSEILQDSKMRGPLCGDDGFGGSRDECESVSCYRVSGGNSTTAVKVYEATEVVKEGAQEVDMVINIGKALSGDWDYVSDEIGQINAAVTAGGAILKVIFETDYLQDSDIIRLCEICSSFGVGFVKTSTGYGFNKQSNGMYSYAGATDHNLKLMRQHSSEKVQIKAAGGVRTLDDLLRVRALGVTRVGATATKEILQEAVKRGIGKEPKTVEVTIPDVIAGRRVANEYLALGTLFSTGAIAWAASRGGSKKKPEPESLLDKAKSTLGVGDSDEEAFIKKFIADAEKEAKH